MEVSSAQQQLCSCTADNRAALDRWLAGRGAAASRRESLGQLAAAFQASHGEVWVDLLDTGAQASCIFYGYPAQLHPQPGLLQLLAAQRPAWRRLDYFALPLAPLCDYRRQGQLAALIAEVGPEDEPQLSAFTRPLAGQRANGDGYWYQHRGDLLTACVVDGLGHGEAAEGARRLAIDCVRDCADQPLAAIFARVHAALRDSRGAAMSLVRVHLREQWLEHAGVGNVELRLAPHKSGFAPRAGVLGMGQEPRPRVTRSPWSPDARLVLHTDGVRGQWRLPGQSPYSARFLSHALVRLFERPGDDATALVVQGR